MVKHVEEVGSELQPEPFRHFEVFLQAGIPVVVAGTAQSVDLRRTGTESGGWVAVVARVKPEESPTRPSGGLLPPKYVVGSIAIRTKAARPSACRIIRVCVQRQREPCV